MGTITKALNLLNFFSISRPEIGLTEFRRLSRQDKTTVHRHLTELAENGLLEQNPDTRRYRLGPAILRLAAVRERIFPARQAVAPIVNSLSEELGELVHVSLLQGDSLSPLCYRDASIHGTRVFFDEAEMLPPHATSSGHAVLAFGPNDLLERVLAEPLTRFTKFTVTDADQLRREVQAVSRTGIAKLAQRFETEVSSIAVPIFDAKPDACGALAVATPTSRLTATLQQHIISSLKRGSRSVSSALGGAVPEPLARIW